MQIVITDGYTLNPGDLDWEAINRLGDVKYFDRMQPGAVAEYCKDTDIIITNKTPVTAATIHSCSNLKFISVTATGYNVIDTVTAKEKGIIVSNVPVYGTDSVAQHTFALLLELANQTGAHAKSVSDGGWSRSPDWSYTLQPTTEISGKTLGIVGFGRIGQRVAEIAKAFGMQVIFYNKGKKSTLAKAVSLEELFAQSDYISLHCPLTKDNDSFVNKALLSLMKPTACLVNTSRGQLINEKDLAAALKEKVLLAAALDVLRQEPPPTGNPLIGLPNCIITPHIAWITKEARKRLMQTTIENVKAFLAGKPQHVVNP
ncbi:MAG: D-2-hydroxyacid dehydrogenase [Ferruginibacter sp.]